MEVGRLLDLITCLNIHNGAMREVTRRSGMTLAEMRAIR